MSVKTLCRQFPHQGRLVWIGIRPARHQPLITPDTVIADSSSGLVDDHYSGRNGKRHVTLFQKEHLTVIESLTGQTVKPEMLRRNFLVEGINLLALKDHSFCIGSAVLQMTGLCHPCSRMEQILGAGGYNAMRGHGGITARIVTGGHIHIGDSITVINADHFDSANEID